jgi:penicillin amidase
MKKSSEKHSSGKIWKSILLWFSIVLLLMLIAAFVFIKIIGRKGLPDYNATVTLDKLTSEVQVYRDEFGTPHIYAETETDLYRAVGYVMAQDRMWQMDLLRRATLGRLSEIFGSDYVETDLLLRSLRYSEKSKKILQESPAELVSALEAFSNGVNQYIEQNQKNLPAEFLILGYTPEKWEPYQSINFIGFMAWDLKAGWNEFVLETLRSKLDSARYNEILPHVDRYKTCVFQSDEETLLACNKLMELEKLEKLGLDILCGSNNWAVSGEKSTTGFPLVANDMHLSFSVPGIWMQMHQVVKGRLNVSGLVLPGQPLVVVGHNDSIAWGMTNTYVDNLDFYEEKINPQDSNQYWYNNQWNNFEVRHETIKIRGGSEIKRDFRLNHRGPVVSQAKGVTNKVITIHWVGDEPSNELLSIYKINRASNWNDFNDAFQYFRSVSQNIVYGDVRGNIGLHACAGVPIRKRDAVFQVLPGWIDEYDWKGMVPYNELPYEYNPERGFVSSANNRNADSTYPFHIGSWYDAPYRIDRIREMIKSKQKLSVDDFKKMQNDSKSKLSERLINKCYKLLDPTKMSPLELKAFNLLKNWDGTMDKELIQPTISEEFLCSLIIRIFKDEIGPELFKVFTEGSRLSRIALFNLLETDNSPWIDDVTTPEKETFQEIVQLAYGDAINNLKEKYSGNIAKWQWGKLHTITFSHPLSKKKILDFAFNLNRGPYGVSGSFHTVSPYSYIFNQPTKVEHGASHRHIFSLANWDSTYSVIPTGNSGVIKSEFYLDQSKMYVEGKYHHDYFGEEAVKQKAKYLMHLLPK